MKHDDDSKQGADSQSDQQPDAVNRSRWKAFFAKRWAFPALYLTAAALIIGLMYFQANRFVSGGNQAASAVPTPSVTVTTKEAWTWPVGSGTKGVDVVRGYYDRNDKSATVQTLAKALVHYDNSYTGSKGYDLAVAKRDVAFSIVAASSGTVSDVYDSPVMGETVVVAGANGYSTIYQSLGTVDVQHGEHVLMGQKIGTSGTNVLEANMGNHLFFEVQKNGVVIDPARVLPNEPL